MIYPKELENEDIYADDTFMRQSEVIQIKYCEEGYLEGCFYIEKFEEIKSILLTLMIRELKKEIKTLKGENDDKKN